MTLADHERLLTRIRQLEGMVILSGYAHPLYQEALAEWDCLQLDTRCSSAVRSLYAQSSPAVPDEWTRTECVWRNPACVQQQPTLFSGLTESTAGA